MDVGDVTMFNSHVYQLKSDPTYDNLTKIWPNPSFKTKLNLVLKLPQDKVIHIGDVDFRSDKGEKSKKLEFWFKSVREKWTWWNRVGLLTKSKERGVNESWNRLTHSSLHFGQ